MVILTVSQAAVAARDRDLAALAQLRAAASSLEAPRACRFALTLLLYDQLLGVTYHMYSYSNILLFIAIYN